MIDWFTTLCIRNRTVVLFDVVFVWVCKMHGPSFVVSKVPIPFTRKTVRRCRKFGSVDAAFLSMSVGSPTVTQTIAVMLWTFPWHRCDDQTGKDIYI